MRLVIFDLRRLHSQNSKSNHRALHIRLECMHRFDCEKATEDNKQLHLSMNLKRAPVYSKMVEDMLHLITKIQHSVKLECKWEVLSYKFNMGRIICISRESDRMKTDRLGPDRIEEPD